MTDAKLPGFDERFADIKGVRMRYFVAGGGPPLVLVHRLGGGAPGRAGGGAAARPRPRARRGSVELDGARAAPPAGAAAARAGSARARRVDRLAGRLRAGAVRGSGRGRG